MGEGASNPPDRLHDGRKLSSLSDVNESRIKHLEKHPEQKNMGTNQE